MLDYTHKSQVISQNTLAPNLAETQFDTEP